MSREDPDDFLTSYVDETDIDAFMRVSRHAWSYLASSPVALTSSRRSRLK